MLLDRPRRSWAKFVGWSLWFNSHCLPMLLSMSGLSLNGTFDVAYILLMNPDGCVGSLKHLTADMGATWYIVL